LAGAGKGGPAPAFVFVHPLDVERLSVAAGIIDVANTGDKFRGAC
jgi:hypothetical protein